MIISSDLNWEHHVISATSKANRALGTIKHAFRYLDNYTFNLLYKSLVRPHLEYAARVWSPYWAKDKNRLESVQRRATKIVSLRGLNYDQRRMALGLPTLEERRRRGDLIEMYKITNSENYINLEEPLSFFDNMSRGRHNKRLHRSLDKKTCRHNFLTNRVVNDWNALSQDAIDSKNKNIFKNKIDKILNLN